MNHHGITQTSITSNMSCDPVNDKSKRSWFVDNKKLLRLTVYHGWKCLTLGERDPKQPNKYALINA